MVMNTQEFTKNYLYSNSDLASSSPSKTMQVKKSKSQETATSSSFKNNNIGPISRPNNPIINQSSSSINNEDESSASSNSGFNPLFGFNATPLLNNTNLGWSNIIDSGNSGVGAVGAANSAYSPFGFVDQENIDQLKTSMDKLLSSSANSDILLASSSSSTSPLPINATRNRLANYNNKSITNLTSNNIPVINTTSNNMNLLNNVNQAWNSVLLNDFDTSLNQSSNNSLKRLWYGQKVEEQPQKQDDEEQADSKNKIKKE
jgi:hypothetical protein